jgi:hypothetical protein
MKQLKQIVFLFFASIFPLVIYAQTLETAEKSFHQIKRIYVENDLPETPEEKRVSPFLRNELAKLGFIIADNKDDADAILLGEAIIEIMTHGDRYNAPDKAIYKYKLLTPRGRQMWKQTVKFPGKFNWTENNKLGARKIAEKLFDDHQKAIKEFGRKAKSKS